jgi:hypothetical protein
MQLSTPTPAPDRVALPAGPNSASPTNKRDLPLHTPASPPSASSIDLRIGERIRGFVLLNRVGLILGLMSFILGSVWAAAIRPFDAPDEPAHLMAVMHVRRLHTLPEIHYDFSVPGGVIVNTYIDQATVDYARSTGITNQYVLGPQESFQAPLYYVVAGLLSHLVPSDPQYVLYVSRLVSVLFGAIMIYFCWAAARVLAPERPLLAVGAAGAIACLPQFCFNSSSVSNDSTINCIAVATLYFSFRGLRDPAYDPWMIRAGAMLGLAFLAKSSAMALIPVVGLVWLFRLFQFEPGQSFARWSVRIKRALRMGAGGAATALAICGWYIIRNIMVYGEPTGLRDAAIYNADKLPWYDFARPEVRDFFITSTWNSFWGVFGWMNIGMPDAFYDQTRIIGPLFAGLSVIAAIWLLARWRAERKPLPPLVWQSTLIMAVIVALITTTHVLISVKIDFQAQGRYLFLMLFPLSLVFMGGVFVLTRSWLSRALAITVPLLWLLAWNIIAIARVWTAA